MLVAYRLFLYVFKRDIELNYDKEIWRVLTEAGMKGISVQKIARHVFNASNTFFETISFEEVHAYVQQYLLKNSKNPDSIIESAGVRGTYRMNPSSKESQQLMLLFREDEQEEPETKQEDQSLSLFDF